MTTALIILGTAVIAGPIGFGICAVLTAGRITDLEERLHRYTVGLTGVLEWKQSLIDRALAVETPKAAHGVRKMAAILRGDA